MAVSSAVLIGFGALAIDVGRLHVVRTELQRTADAAALAGVTGLATTGKLTNSDASIADAVWDRATTIALRNRVFGTGSHLRQNDVQCGTIEEPKDLNSPFVTAGPSSANAVRVVVRRTTDSPDGPVPLTFAAIFGRHFAPVVATATAVLDDRFAGYRPPATGDGVLLPFTIRQDVYENQLVNGNDRFSSDDGIQLVGDGVREIRLYPIRQRLDGTPDGAGTFGVLNVGTQNLGLAGVERQVLNGITPDDFTNEIGTPEIRFIDDAGGAITHDITGDTGISAGIKAVLTERIGDVIGFFIHTTVVDPGANSVFTVVNMQFGRVMEVDLTGSVKSGKGIIIQPVAYAGSGVITDPSAPSTGGRVSGIWLAR